MIHCDERFLLDIMQQNMPDDAKDAAWLNGWTSYNKVAREIVLAEMANTTILEEGKIVAELRRLLPDKAGLFIGNSMPICDVDTYFSQIDKKIKMLANRGANGIDGVVSSALGASVVFQPMFLLIGDLSFYHDMNGLLMAKKYKMNLTIVIVNNDGGGYSRSYLKQTSRSILNHYLVHLLNLISVLQLLFMMQIITRLSR